MKRQRLLNCLKQLHLLVIAYADYLGEFSDGLPERELILDLSVEACKQAREVRNLFARHYGYEP